MQNINFWIFVRPIVPPAQMHDLDRTVAGRYLASASDTPEMALETLTGFALNSFHENVAIKVLDDFEIIVTLADEPSRIVIADDDTAGNCDDWTNMVMFNIEQLESRPELFGLVSGKRQTFAIEYHPDRDMVTPAVGIGYLGYVDEFEAYCLAVDREQENDSRIFALIGPADVDRMHRDGMARKSFLKNLPDNPFSQNDPHRYRKDCAICEGCQNFSEVGKARGICSNVDFALPLDGLSQWPAKTDENGTLIECKQYIPY